MPKLFRVRRPVSSTAPLEQPGRLDEAQVWADWSENAQLSRWRVDKYLNRQLGSAVAEAARMADAHARLEYALRRLR